ncbi:transmembrane protein [Cryptococcus neoformans]|nr:transmembrane protein [Cryptococcus neoformans var. grubii]OXC58545.1 transmembrane protein [Cryptococcus neoformans var. grubii MW-RSA852]
MPFIKALDHAIPNGQTFNNLSKAPGAVAGGLTSAVGSVGNVVGVDQVKGAAVHMFDPDASPAVKAAAAAKAKASLGLPSRDKVREGISGDGGGARAVIIDSSTSANAPKPTVTLADVDKASQAEGQREGGDDMPGSIPSNTAPSIPTWVMAGWKQAAGLGKTESAREEATVLQTYLTETMYGAWYHNAAVILFAILSTRLFTVLHLGWGWIIVVLAFCSSYYSISISRTRQRVRDDIQRELVKTRLVTETESADWINSFLERFWLIYEPVLSQTIIASTDAALAGVAPPGVDSIRMTTFTLGTKAPRIDYVRTFPKTPEDIVIMDWALSFTPNDLEDITPRQAAKQVNPKVVLGIRVGKGALSKALPVLLEDMSFSGKMRIKLKLMTNFPHVQTVDISFIEKPTFDYVLKPIGGETLGFDINSIPGLAPFIRDQVHSNLGPMMYDPNVFTIDLQQLLSGTPLDAAIGVLRVTVLDARSLKATKFGGGDPDPYVSFSIGAKPAIAQTKTVRSTSNPSFHETQFLLINSLADVLNLNVFDFNDHRPDSLLGTVSHELGTLADDAEQEGIIGQILGGGKDRGTLRYDLSYFPVLKPEKNADGTLEPLPDTQTGIVRLTIHQAKDLDVSSALLGGRALNPFASVFLGSGKNEVHRTKVLKHANQPIWEDSCEFLVPEKHNSVVTVAITDSRDFANYPSLGMVTIRLADLLEAKERHQDWFPLKGSRQGKVRMTAEWKAVAMTGSIGGANSYIPPIGILRVWLKRAVDVKNVEAALGGKSDPYVRIMGNNRIMARTEVISNNLNPEWDQIIYVPVHSIREHFMLEVMDYQNIGKDRSLGHVDLAARDYINESGEQKYPYISKGSQDRRDRIKLDKANHFKGELHYEVDFKPAVSLRGGISFDAQKNELELAAEAAEAQSAAGGASSGATATVTPEANGSIKVAPTPSGVVGVDDVTAGDANGHEASISVVDASIAAAAPKYEEEDAQPETDAEDPQKGVIMSTEEILSCQSGVLVFQVISGQLARRGSLEVMFDDGYWPAFTSGKARSNHPTWDQVGEGFIRELDFSRVWLRINAADENSKEDVVAEFKCETKDFLERCINAPYDFVLTEPDGSNRSTVQIAARFVPVDIVLQPRESINNMGILRVDVIDAKALHGADRSGKSDPYVVFSLNDMKVFKSETKKKTIHPVWNESFETMVPSRVAAKFAFEIFDWDRVGTATSLGGNTIDLAVLEPFEATEVSLPVITEKRGEKGTFTFRLLFTPEIIARVRHNTGSFVSAGRAITQIGGVPLGVGKGVIHGGGAVAGGVAHGLGSVGGFAGRRIGLIKKKDKLTGKEVVVDPVTGTSVPMATGTEITPAISESSGIAAGQTSAPVGANLDGAVPGHHATTLPIGESASPQEPGTLGVTVISAKDLKSNREGSVKPYVQIRAGGKTVKTEHVKGSAPEWNESFSFNITPNIKSFSVTVCDHHTLGKDPELGEAEVDIWRHIQPAVPDADVWVELSNGTGLLRLKLDWNTGLANPTPMRLGSRIRTPSVSSKSLPDSPGRFSMRKSKE